MIIADEEFLSKILSMRKCSFPFVEAEEPQQRLYSGRSSWVAQGDFPCWKPHVVGTFFPLPLHDNLKGPLLHLYKVELLPLQHSPGVGWSHHSAQKPMVSIARGYPQGFTHLGSVPNHALAV